MSTVGYFFWEAGLLGPAPVKVEAEMHKFRSQQPEHKARMLTPAVELDAAMWSKPIDWLAMKYPVPR